MKPRHADDGMKCPLWRKLCVKVCHECEFWEQIRGKHPQTGQDVDHWACAIRNATLLSIENTMAQRTTTASIDNLRNEVQQANDQAMVGTLLRLNDKIDSQIESQPSKLIGN